MKTNKKLSKDKKSWLFVHYVHLF
ncbi:KxYKxGKxW signal peptide domain-containing protein [uncultured Paraglaciecola sp.]